MKIESKLKTLTDDDLLRGLSDLVQDSRRVEADLIAHIAEVDARRLYAREAAPSMFAYCTERLHLSEQEAYLRIAVARASRQYPALLAMLRDGRLHLSAVARLAPHLTPTNVEALLKRAAHKSRRQVEELIAEVAPRPDVPTVVRKLPRQQPEKSANLQPQLCPDRVESSSLNTCDGVTVDSNSTHERQAPACNLNPPAPDLPERLPFATPGHSGKGLMQPLSPERYKVQFTCGPEVRDTLERLQALMRSSVPDGDIAKIIQVALAEKLERLEARRFGKTKAHGKAVRAGSRVVWARKGAGGAPTASRVAGKGTMRTRAERAKSSPTSRHIPAAVRRHVYARDGGRCVYRDKQGRRCTSRHDLEFHHRYPHGYGGEASSDNVALMCRAHNALMAEVDYGKAKMKGFRRSASSGLADSKPPGHRRGALAPDRHQMRPDPVAPP